MENNVSIARISGVAMAVPVTRVSVNLDITTEFSRRPYQYCVAEVWAGCLASPAGEPDDDGNGWSVW
ncbi:hypothetical protein LBMAG38_20070 [Chloroflexota bacterium]|nr:hypothetical protein LBMAG38_20070 [Chloroflexota bacterium]